MDVIKLKGKDFLLVNKFRRDGKTVKHISSIDPVRMSVELDTYRVIMRRHRDTPSSVVEDLREIPRLSAYDYEIWVGDNAVRYLTTEQLPNDIKSKLAMIMAVETERSRWPDLDPSMVSITPYMNSAGDEFSNIGWRVSENLFCVVIDGMLLESLRGSGP